MEQKRLEKLNPPHFQDILKWCKEIPVIKGLMKQRILNLRMWLII